MQKILIEGEEYSCLDIVFLGEQEDGYWFEIVEDGHEYNGIKFGLDNVVTEDGYNVEYEMITTTEEMFHNLKPIVDDFLIVFLGRDDESKDSI